VPPPGFGPEASAVDYTLWIDWDPEDAGVRRAWASVLANLEPPMRLELAALVDAIDRGAVPPERVSVTRFAGALVNRRPW
jgi:hypothetical protein